MSASSIRRGWAPRSPMTRATTTPRSPRTRSPAGRAGLDPPFRRAQGGSRPALHPSPLLRDNAIRHPRGPTSMLVIGVAGTALNAAERDGLQHDACAAEILFTRNVTSSPQRAALLGASPPAPP